MNEDLGRGHPHRPMRRTVLAAVLGVALLSLPIEAQEGVSFPTQDGGLIFADVYGEGTHAIVLAHGARYDKESWSAEARELAEAGFRVLAIDFRGYGESKGPGQEDPLSAPLHLDVLAAVRYLRAQGAETVSVVGGSMGGYSAADASAESEPGEIDRLVVLGAGAGSSPEKLTGRKLFITARECLYRIRVNVPGIPVGSGQ